MVQGSKKSTIESNDYDWNPCHVFPIDTIELKASSNYKGWDEVEKIANGEG